MSVVEVERAMNDELEKAIADLRAAFKKSGLESLWVTISAQGSPTGRREAPHCWRATANPTTRQRSQNCDRGDAANLLPGPIERMTKRISVGIRGKADRKRERIGSGDEPSRAPFLFGIAAPLLLIIPLAVASALPLLRPPATPRPDRARTH
jgi:hypothetical protein